MNSPTTEQRFGTFCRRVCKQCSPIRGELGIREILQGCPVIRLAAYRRLYETHSPGTVCDMLASEVDATITTKLIDTIVAQS
jgi:hypothetical protein